MHGIHESTPLLVPTPNPSPALALLSPLLSSPAYLTMNAILQALGEYFEDLAVGCGEGDVVSCFISMSGHVMGGAYADKEVDTTAFYHRKKTWLLFGMFGNVFLPIKWAQWLTQDDLERGKRLANEACR